MSIMHSVKQKCGWSQWSKIFNDEEVASIIEYGKSLPTVEALTGDNFSMSDNEEIRKSTISWINRDDDNSWIFDRINGCAYNLNNELHGFDIEYCHTLQFTRYEDDYSHYTWHWDMYTRSNSLERNDICHQRKFSAVVQLSDPEDYEGGELQLSPCGNITNMQKEKGLLVCFPSFLLHRVLPVTKGQRYSLVAWFTGPDWR